ncbi:ABC transporter substrate-binding protein [Microcoleus asticus]|uniref:Leucine-, isoleucine-, valine-, threonine-, and alanine-binding protein n=1 Tax=Microcoleus asticus IPMA8 TaxID=2563858 RepID=A0ABX2CTZ4_9CYAN|nr:ABC transporter substrate-binding protein [Microcoleus asticus]NQE33393.1 Leucine-, isoleucine-, valine-, threonine-, and alanine-binding protein [Microcoleus asticus IPMA8]
MYQDTNKKNTPPPIVFIIAIGLIGFGAYKFLPGLLNAKTSNTPISTSTSATSASGAIANRISLGNRILVTSQTTAAKQAGVQAFADGNYQSAAEYFQKSLQQNRNDPETVIYFNNARASNGSSLKIAVSVPIGSNPNVAQEILRGVAQAQDEINTSGGINGAELQVEIVNDDNSPEVVREVAKTLTKDQNILAVIGHNASNASLEAAPIYQQEKLVMVTPTSLANNLSGFGSYIFRTVPNISLMAAPLAEYAVKTAGKTNIAICYDSQAPDNISFKDEFVASLTAAGGKLVPTVCDFSIPSFNPESAIADAVSKGAQGLMVAPHVDRIDRAISLARINRGKLPLYGSTTMYTIQTLKDGQSDVNGLVLPVPWHPETNPGSRFPENSRQRWGGIVNWRTATSFDATQAVIAGLRQSNTREGLQQALRNTSFSTPGASDDVKFLPTGDRAGKPILVQVKQGGSTGYNFVPLR